MKPSSLPIPLNLLQAASASEISSLNLIFPVLAYAIGSQVPRVDLSNFIEEVKDFEEHYTFWEEVNKIFSEVYSWNSQIIELLKQNQIIKVELNSSEIKLWEAWGDFFRSKDILDFREVGRNVRVTETGTLYECLIVPLFNLMYVISNPKFKF